jgi:(2Fe-2S) ferredoxin
VDDGPLFFPTRAHLLLCTGPRCSRRGSPRVFHDSWRELESRSLAYYKRGGSIRLSESGCLGCCAHGPTLAAYYDDGEGRLAQAWWVAMTAEQLLEIAKAIHDGRALPDRNRFGPR